MHPSVLFPHRHIIISLPTCSPSKLSWPVFTPLAGYCPLPLPSVHPICPSKSCPGQYSETLYDRCFIYWSRSILHESSALSHFDLQSWKYKIHLENVVWAFAQNYEWQLFDIFRAYQLSMWPVHCRIILTFDLDIITYLEHFLWPIAQQLYMKLWPLTLKSCLQILVWPSWGVHGCWEVRLKTEFSLSKKYLQSWGHAKHNIWYFYLCVF